MLMACDGSRGIIHDKRKVKKANKNWNEGDGADIGII